MFVLLSVLVGVAPLAVFLFVLLYLLFFGGCALYALVASWAARPR